MLVQITLLKNGWPVVECKSESNCPFLSYDRTSYFTANDKEFSFKIRKYFATTHSICYLYMKLLSHSICDKVSDNEHMDVGSEFCSN